MKIRNIKDDKIRLLAIENFKKMEPLDTILDIDLEDAFDWGETLEGDKFWWAVDDGETPEIPNTEEEPEIDLSKCKEGDRLLCRDGSIMIYTKDSETFEGLLMKLWRNDGKYFALREVDKDIIQILPHENPSISISRKELYDLLKNAYRWGRDNGSNRSEKNFNDMLETNWVKKYL